MLYLWYTADQFHTAKAKHMSTGCSCIAYISFFWLNVAGLPSSGFV